MIAWKALPIKALTEIYVVSNTASYLYDAFRKNERLAEMGREVDADSLVNDITGLLKKPPRTIPDVVTIYAGLVLASFSPNTAEIVDRLRQLDYGSLRWARQILEFTSQMVTTQHLYLPYQPTLGAEQAVNEGSVSSYVRLPEQGGLL